MNPSPPELFPQRPIRSDFGRAPSYRTRRIVTVLVCVFLITGVLYRFVGRSRLPPGEIPTIKAETNGWKQRPEQPGGIDIPHQDVEVYQALDGTDAAAKSVVEHLLPPPETPQPTVASAPVPEPNTTTAEVPMTSSPQPESLTQQSQASAETIAPEPAPTLATTVQPSSPQRTTTAPVVKSASDPMPQISKDTAKSAKTIRVQLASVPDETSANQMMQRLQNRYASILGDAHLRLMRADLGDKGTYYRIQSQLLSGDQANTICSAIKKMKAGCILAR